MRRRGTRSLIRAARVQIYGQAPVYPSSERTRRCSCTRGGAIAEPRALYDSYGYSSIRIMIRGEDNITGRWGVSSPRMAVETTLATTMGDSVAERGAR
jgi:hypothetical protein